MKKQTKTLLTIFGIIFFIALIGITGWKFGLFQQEILPTDKIYYPLYGSVGCEAVGANAWKTASQIPDITKNTEILYTCPAGTSQCRFNIPTLLTCEGFSYSPYYQVAYKGRNYAVIDYDKDIGVSNFIPANGVEFAPLEYITVKVKCRNLLFQSKPVVAGNTNIQYIDTLLYRYPAMEGKFNIPNTNLCIKNDAVNAIIHGQKLFDIQPTDSSESIAQSAKEIAKDLTGKELDAQKENDANIKDIPNQMTIGTYYLYVDKWIELTGFNANPLGQYQGKNVICSPFKGLFELKKVNTIGSTSYFVPATRLTSPSNLCCNHQDCKSIGTDYNCKDYSCQKNVEAQCRVDVDCQPQGGEKSVDNCYQKQGTMDFYQWTGSCISGVCKFDQAKVKCCPSYCALSGKWCDPKVGCQDAIIPTNPCPPNSCCDGQTHLKKGCDSGLTCCIATNEHVGSCKVKCVSGEDDDLCPALWSIGGKDSASPLLFPKETTIIPNFSCASWFDTFKLISTILLSLFAFVFLERWLKGKYPAKKEQTTKWILTLALTASFVALLYLVFWVAFWIAIVILIGRLLTKIFLKI